MKTLINSSFLPAIFLIVLLSLPGVIQAQERAYFSKVVYDVSSESPQGAGLRASHIQADQNGGVFEIRVPNSAGTCYDDLQFSWRFPDDISVLSDLKSSMVASGDSKSIASAISNYRQVIARKVESCSCK